MNVFVPKDVTVEFSFHLIRNVAVHVPPFALNTSFTVGPPAACVTIKSVSLLVLIVNPVSFASVS